ncbi:MAG: hypothetical protein KBA46_04675, partial [Candidatus Omnitrophica bacterium]|nr:hypothetical protein [Candidatus Omnitrophota bacterium]
MNKRGVALVFALIVLVVVSLMVVSFFMRTMSENNMVKRETNSLRALWLAEAGAADTISRLPTQYAPASPLTGTLATGNTYSATSVLVASSGSSETYVINSTGSVVIPGSGPIQKEVELYVDLTPPDPGDFTHGLEVNGELRIQGSAEVDNPLAYANLNFREKFGLSSADLKAIAQSGAAGCTYLVDPDPPLQDLSGITWIDIVEHTQQKIPKTGWNGSGILIVNGDCGIEGGDFDGILWVIGDLEITGNPVYNGAVFGETSVDFTTKVTGTPDINLDPDAIQDALD